MAPIRVGTSGYNYESWRGPFYPPDLPESRMLAYYAERFDTVEINYSFYRMPTVRVLHGWAKETPAEFQFSLKAPRRITHDLQLRDAGEPLTDFCETARSLKEKLGALLFQLPPYLKKDTARLEDFLHQAPTGLRIAFEFRHASWFSDDVFECMRRFDVALCVSEAEQHQTPFEQTARFGYFRLRKPDYGDGELAAWADRLRGAAAGWETAFVYFKHEAEGKGPRLARRLRELLAPGGEAGAAVEER